MWKLGLTNSDPAKKKLIRIALKGVSEKQLQTIANNLVDRFEQLCYQKATDCLDQHKKQGDDIYLVSASCSIWLKPWVNHRSIRLISTELEIKDGVATGALATKNCIREEKVRRIKSEVNLNDFDSIYVYGNGRGDKEMLSLANQPVVDISA